MFKDLYLVEVDKQSAITPEQGETDQQEQWHGIPAQTEELPKGVIEDEI